MIFSIPTDKLSMKDSKGMNKVAKNLMFYNEELSRFRFISWQKFEQIFDTKKSLGWLKKNLRPYKISESRKQTQIQSNEGAKKW